MKKLNALKLPQDRGADVDNYSTSFSRRGGYIFSQIAISSIAASIARFTEAEVSTSISLSEDHNVEGNNVSLLLLDTYVVGREIERMRFTSSGPALDGAIVLGVRRTTIVTLSASRHGPAVDVSIRGDRNPCLAFRSEIETIIDGQRQWYHRLWLELPTLFDLLLYLSLCFAFFVIGILILNRIVGKDLAKELAWVGGLFSLGITGCFPWLHRKLFPRICFDFGRSERRVQSARRWREIVGVVVVLGFIISVLASLFYDSIK